MWGVKMSNAKAGKTETVKMKIENHVSEAKARVILFGTGIDVSRDWEFINKTYCENRYKAFEEAHQVYMNDAEYVKAYKIALEHNHQIRLIELYNLYFNKAKEDTNSFKAFIDFSEKFFNSDKGDSELMGLLKGVKLDG